MKALSTKKMLSFTLPLTLVLFAAGCQPQQSASSSSSSSSTTTSSNDSSSSKVTTLNVYSWTTEDSMKPFFDAFEKKYPNIKIKYTKMADANAQTANTLLTSGDAIDVIPQASVDDMRLRAENGMYEPLDQYLKADNIDFAQTFGKEVNDLEMVNGKHYAIPYSIVTYGLYYNKSLFDKAGIPYPTDNWTWDDLRAAANKLTSGSGANKIYGFLPRYVGANEIWAFPAIEQLGTNYSYTNNGNASNWDNPAFLKSLQFFNDMETKDKSSWPLSEYKALKLDSNPIPMFFQGRAAMVIEPSYIVRYSSIDSYGFKGNFDFGVVNLPKVSQSDPLKNIFYVSDYSIPVNAPHKQEAWKYIKFYTMEAPEIFAKSKGMPPANISSMDPAGQQAVGKALFNYPHFDQDSGNKTYITNKPQLISSITTDTKAKQQISDLVDNEVTSALLGNETPEQAIANMKKQSDALIAKASK